MFIICSILFCKKADYIEMDHRDRHKIWINVEVGRVECRACGLGRGSALPHDILVQTKAPHGGGAFVCGGGGESRTLGCGLAQIAALKRHRRFIHHRDQFDSLSQQTKKATTQGWLLFCGGGGESRTPVREHDDPTFYERSRRTSIPLAALPTAGSPVR